MLADTLCDHVTTLKLLRPRLRRKEKEKSIHTSLFKFPFHWMSLNAVFLILEDNASGTSGCDVPCDGGEDTLWKHNVRRKQLDCVFTNDFFFVDFK